MKKYGVGLKEENLIWSCEEEGYLSLIVSMCGESLSPVVRTTLRNKCSVFFYKNQQIPADARIFF